MLQNVFEPNPRVSEAELKSFAQRYGIRLPEAYERFLLNTNGGQPVPAAFRMDGMADNPSGHPLPGWNPVPWRPGQ